MNRKTTSIIKAGAFSLLGVICVLNTNTAVSGGVIYSGDDSYARLTNCILSGNAALSPFESPNQDQNFWTKFN